MYFLLFIVILLILVIVLLIILLNRKSKLLKKNIEEQYKGYIKKSFFSRAFFAFKKYTLQILITISLLIIILFFCLKYSGSELFNNHKDLFKEIYGLGLAIFSSGIFLAVLKWFQFNGFFKEELHSADEFEDIPFPNQITKVYNNILLPDRGFKLIFIPKS